MGGTQENVEDSPQFIAETILTAASDEKNSLEGINVDGVVSGAICYVRQNDRDYRYYEFSPAVPVFPTVIAPAIGPGVWIIQPGSGGGGGAPLAISASNGTANGSVSSGTVVFSNSNGVSFGILGSTITASVVAAGTGAIAAISGGTTQATSGTVSFANGNGVSFGMAGQVMTASVAGGAAGSISAGTTSASLGQVAFSLSGSGNVAFGMGGNTVTASVSASSLSFVNSNGVTFGTAGSTLTASVAAGATATGNFGGIAAGTQTATSGTVVFANSNSITFGMSGSSQITASFSQSTTPPGSLSAGTSSATLGQIVFSSSGSGNVAFGMSGNTITASIAGADGGVGVSAAGASAGTGTVVFSNSNNVSFGMAGSTVTASASQSAFVLSNSNGLAWGTNGSTVTGSYSQSTMAAGSISAGTTSASLGQVVFSNGSGVSFGMNAGTVTASVAAGATATGNFGGIAAGTQTATSGTVVFANSNSITFGMSGSSQITASFSQSTTPAGSISAGTTSASLGQVIFSNSNNVSFGMNAGTVTASFSPGVTFSMFEWPPAERGTSNAFSNGTQYFNPFTAPQHVTATQGKILMSANVSSIGAGTTNSGTVNVLLGIYTLNQTASTAGAAVLSLATSGSQSFGWTVTGATMNTYQGVKEFTVPMDVLMTPGVYWFGHLVYTSGDATASIGLTRVGVPNALLNWSGVFGAAPATSARLLDGLGLFGASSTALQASMMMNTINHSVPGVAAIYFVLRATS